MTPVGVYWIEVSTIPSRIRGFQLPDVVTIRRSKTRCQGLKLPILDLTCDGTEETIRNVDRIALALGVKAFDDLSAKIKGMVDEVYVIGDAKEPRKALQAIAEGRDVEMKI